MLTSGPVACFNLQYLPQEGLSLFRHMFGRLRWRLAGCDMKHQSDLVRDFVPWWGACVDSYTEYAWYEKSDALLVISMRTATLTCEHLHYCAAYRPNVRLFPVPSLFDDLGRHELGRAEEAA